MKRIFYILSAMVLLYACQVAIEVDEPVVDQNNSGTEIPTTIYASIGDKDNNNNAESRTYVSNYKNVLWSNNDLISFYIGNRNNLQYIYRGDDGATNATFEFVHDLQGYQPAVEHTQAIYPYDPYTKCVKDEANDANILTVYYRAEQEYTYNSFAKGASFMVSTGYDVTDNNMYFYNASGYLIIKLYASDLKIKSLTLSPLSDDIKIAGEATIISKHNTIPQISMTNNATSSVTINCGENGLTLGKDAENATEFWFAIPPTTFEGGFRIEAVDIYNNHIVKQTTKTISVERNCIHPMQAIQLEKKIPEDQIITYTRSYGDEPFRFSTGIKYPFDAKIVEHYLDSITGKYAIVFDSKVTSIKDSAFMSSNLSSIDLPNSIKILGSMAFVGTELTQITIPASVDSVGEYLCYECRKLTEAHVSAKKLARSTFSMCPSLKSVTITSSVDSIGNNTFYYCSSLSTVNIEESQKPLCLGYMISGFAEYGAFYYSPLASINLKREIKYKDEKGKPFTPGSWEEGVFANKHYDEKSLTTDISLGVYVRNISEYMFSGVRVEHLWIPQEITSIGYGAFAYCYILNGITCNHTTPPALGDDAFYDTGADLDKGKMSYINVLKGYAEVFKTTGNWAKYADIVTEWEPKE